MRNEIEKLDVSEQEKSILLVQKVNQQMEGYGAFMDDEEYDFEKSVDWRIGWLNARNFAKRVLREFAESV